MLSHEMSISQRITMTLRGGNRVVVGRPDQSAVTEPSEVASHLGVVLA